MKLEAARFCILCHTPTPSAATHPGHSHSKHRQSRCCDADADADANDGPSVQPPTHSVHTAACALPSENPNIFANSPHRFGSVAVAREHDAARARQSARVEFQMMQSALRRCGQCVVGWCGGAGGHGGWRLAAGRCMAVRLSQKYSLDCEVM